jgi:hypothetical protein
MADIFGKELQSYGGGFRSDLGIIQEAGGLSGVMMQSLQITYQRPITKIYDLGTVGKAVSVYYVEGRPNGTMQVARIVGFGPSMATFYATYGDACNAKKNSLIIRLGSSTCGTGGSSGGVVGALTDLASTIAGTIGTAFGFGAPAAAAAPLTGIKSVELSMCVLTSVGLSVQAQQLIVNENSAMEFANMSITE